jgi:ABC-type antimicrobial peptide transport system permease subunit
MVLGRGLSLALVGAAAGVLGGLAASRFLETRLHGIDAQDPVSFALGAGVAVAVALLAGLLPALRAARLDPAVAVRSE